MEKIKNNNEDRQVMRAFGLGALHVLPLCLAVIPWGILAGSMAVDAGLTFAQSVGMSAIIFAGAAQLVTLGLVASGAGMLTIIFSVFFIKLSIFIRTNLTFSCCPFKMVSTYYNRFFING